MSGAVPKGAPSGSVDDNDDGAPFGAINNQNPGDALAVTLESLAKLNEEPVVIRLVNVPLERMSVQSYTLDLDSGIVTFTHPVGWLLTEGGETKLEKGGVAAPEMGVLRTDSRVRLTFAYEDSALAREGAIALGAALPSDLKGQGAVRYHYHALYLREATKPGVSPVKPLTVNLVDPDLKEDARYPQLVTDDTLRLVFPLEEESNLADLDRRSREIAQSLLNGDQEVSGEDGEAYRLLPMDPSSVIGRVSWEGDATGCRTSWTIGISKAAKAKTLAARIAAEAQPKAIGGRQ